jgi:hypothetical protein
MALLPFTHVLRQKTATGYTLNEGLMIEGAGFMLVSQRQDGEQVEDGIYRIIGDLSDSEVLPSREALERGWYDNAIGRTEEDSIKTRNLQAEAIHAAWAAISQMLAEETADVPQEYIRRIANFPSSANLVAVKVTQETQSSGAH